MSPADLTRELWGRVGLVHAALEVDTDPEIALEQLQGAQRELEQTIRWLADEMAPAGHLACPFCGGTGLVERSVGPHGRWVREVCAACSARDVVRRALANPQFAETGADLVVRELTEAWARDPAEVACDSTEVL